MAAFIHVVPKRLQAIVRLEAPRAGELCDDCRRELAVHRPKVLFKEDTYCLICALGMGLVSRQRRPREAVPA